MRIHRLLATGTALVIVSGCADGRAVLDPTAPTVPAQRQSSSVQASASRQIETSGAFDAIVDFSTLKLTPRGSNCLLQVKGQLVFSGTIEGTGVGQTSALVKAPCSEVAVTPPGTYPDVFKSELVFEGTIDGEPARAKVLYMGGVEPGGHIDGRLVFSNGVAGRLEVDAQVAVGGTYHGSLVVH